eukprot:UN08731
MLMLKCIIRNNSVLGVRLNNIIMLYTRTRIVKHHITMDILLENVCYCIFPSPTTILLL